MLGSNWAIDNNLHWTLDVQFKEGASLIRNGYAAENMSAICKKIGFDEQFMVDVINSYIYNCS